MNSTPEKWVLLPDRNSEGWRIVVENSLAHRYETSNRVEGDWNEGGILGCSEWLWLDEKHAKMFVRVPEMMSLLEALANIYLPPNTPLAAEAKMARTLLEELES